MKRTIFYSIVLSMWALMFITLNAGFCETSNESSISISSLDFENADIKQIMKTLSEIGHRNIILDKDITGQCSIYLRDVTWEEALVAVLKMNDLVAYDDRGFIKVIPKEEFDAQQNALKEKQKKEVQEKKLEEPVKVHVVKINNARAEDIKSTLDPLLGEKDRPAVDLRTNSLVFTVTDSSLAVVREIIEELDTETRQVSIEVKMITVDARSITEMGINWSAIKNGNEGVQNTIGEEGKLLVGTYSGKISNTVIEATIATLIDKNEAEIVSRPHVTTQDNEPATISSGQQVPIITYDEARNSVINLVPAITELTVTPHILSEDRILLDVSASRRSAEGVGVGLKINEELATVKMITTDGETAVIGGMRQMQESKTESGIPILQDVPLIGQLFKYTKRENKKTDLIIFITPRVISKVESQLSEQ